jgi:hypothetical protein
MLFWLSHKNRTGVAEIGPVLLSTLEKAGWLEKDLENVLSARIPDVLRENQLMVIFQERRRQEEPDILAFDISGALHIFELKEMRERRAICCRSSDMGKSLGSIRMLIWSVCFEIT